MTTWLRSQKKSELVDIAETVGLKNVATLKKIDLESSLDEYLTENASLLSSDPRLAPYFNVRGKSIGTPVKREAGEVRMPRRRTIKAVEEAPTTDDDESAARSTARPTVRSSALTRTPARALSLAGRIPLPSTPAEVAQAVDRSAVAVRERVVSIYADSGITEATQITRESLSSVYSIIFLVSAFETYFLQPEVLPNRYAFSIPAIKFLHTPVYGVHLPDIFLLATSSFWSPVLTWTAISVVFPALIGYFFNLSAASGSHHSGRGRSRPFSTAEYAVDPLTFSVAKALLLYAVLGQGVTFGGWIDTHTVSRINTALYGGLSGALVGTAVTGLASLYDAVLRK